MADLKRPDLSPVIVVGGDANALSIARNLGRAGIPVYALNYPSEMIRHSRYARYIDIPTGDRGGDAWAEYLLSPASDHLIGAVLLAASDEAIMMITNHRDALLRKYKLDLSDSCAQRQMLNKLATYIAAREAGVPTPKFWIAETLEDVEAVRDDLVYPLLVKPQFTHEFGKRFKGKFITVDNYADLCSAFETITKAGIRTLLMEKIPGPDDQLCSYYTYLDEEGTNCFDFTKRIIRRFPVNMGGACYHITDYVPDVKELALRLFRHVGLRGLANAEFKRDTRDGQLKLIECNARFTAADCLVAASGFNLSLFVYRRLTGRPQEPLVNYRSGVRLWDPRRDYYAFRQLRDIGQLSFGQWLRSVLRPQTFSYFAWYDPVPGIMKSPYSRRLFSRWK